MAVTAVVLCVAGSLVWASLGRAGRAFAGTRDPWLGAAAPASSAHDVVVAELFTSEGCSSCPPADEVLRRLVREPVDGTIVLGLGEHVDYWDHLGWRDPFSSPAFSNRQAEYQGQVFRAGSIYTPQLVVDGQFEVIGSDVPAVRRAIANAARIPKAAIDVAASLAGDGLLSVRVRMSPPAAGAIRERADLIVALTQDHLASEVRRGENHGRVLAHSAVVRSLTALGSVQPPVRAFDKTVTIPVAADWEVRDVRVIGLLQERRSRRIVGAGSAHVSAREAPSSVN